MATKPTQINNLQGKNVDLMNALRNTASAYYQSIVPVVSDGVSISQAGVLITANPDLRNEFFSALMNRIAFVFGSSRSYYNKYAGLKKGDFELGEVAEEVFIEAAKPNSYDPEADEDKLFKRVISDVKTAFHVVNAQFYYTATINRPQLSKAFTTERGLYDLVEAIVKSLTNGGEIDEQNVIKYIFARAVLDGRIRTEVVTGDSTEVAKIMKQNADDMTFPRTDFNEAGVLNWTDYPYMKFFLSTKFGSEYSIDVLSASFQLKYTDFMGEVYKFDSLSNVDFDRLKKVLNEEVTPFSEDEKEALDKVIAFIFDESYVQWYNRLREFSESPYNARTLEYNVNQHLWEVFSTSPFAPVIGYVTEKGSITNVNVTPTAITLGVGASFDLTVKVNGTGVYLKTYTIEADQKDDVQIVGNNVKVLKRTTGTVTLTVKSVQDPSKTATCTITIPE